MLLSCFSKPQTKDFFCVCAQVSSLLHPQVWPPEVLTVMLETDPTLPKFGVPLLKSLAMEALKHRLLHDLSVVAAKVGPGVTGQSQAQPATDKSSRQLGMAALDIASQCDSASSSQRPGTSSSTLSATGVTIRPDFAEGLGGGEPAASLMAKLSQESPQKSTAEAAPGTTGVGPPAKPSAAPTVVDGTVSVHVTCPKLGTGIRICYLFCASR